MRAAHGALASLLLLVPCTVLAHTVHVGRRLSHWLESFETALSADQWYHFHEHGYVLLPGFFGGERFAKIENARGHLDAMWNGSANACADKACRTGVQFQPLKFKTGAQWNNNKLLNIGPKYARMREENYRLYGADILPSPNPWSDLGRDRKLLDVVGALIGGSPLKNESLIFEYGTEQAMHLDTWYALGGVRKDGMVAAWIALDDVTADNGPLLYVPGSHKLKPRMTRTPTDYRGGRSVMPDKPTNVPGATAYVESEIKRRGLERVELRASAGDVFIWHEMLYHGGAPIRKPGTRRRSTVWHYNADW